MIRTPDYSLTRTAFIAYAAGRHPDYSLTEATVLADRARRLDGIIVYGHGYCVRYSYDRTPDGSYYVFGTES